MPRPPRRPAAARPGKPQNATSALAAQPMPSTSSSDIYDVSDREKERAAAARQKAAQEKESHIAAPKMRTRADRAQTVSTETTASQKRILDKAHLMRDAAMERLENMTSTTSDNEEGGEDEDSEEVAINVAADKAATATAHKSGRRETETPLQKRLTDASGLDLDDSMFDDLNTTVDTMALPHAQGSALRSAETSTMSGSNYRRQRPRAGSFLSRDDGPIRPSSRTGNNTPAFSSTLNFGVFKRREREPSILSTAQKPRPQRPEPEHESDDEIEGDSLADDSALDGRNDFAPEDESTPLRRSKRRSGAVEVEQSDSNPPSRKRKSTDGHERRVRSSPFADGDLIRDSVEQPASDGDLSEPSLPPQHRPSTPVMHPSDPALMAPPMSSGSSESEEEAWPQLQNLVKSRGRRRSSVAARLTPAVNNDDLSDMSSPPSLTHSPNYGHSSSPPPARTRAAKTKKTAEAPKPPPKVTTAQLTDLLPRRRRRAANVDAFDIDEDESDTEVDISGLGDDDDDELTHNVQAKRRPASRAGTGNKTNNATTHSTNRVNKGKPATAGATTNKKRISRTYGRLSDQENQRDEAEDEDEPVDGVFEEEDSQMMTERLGEELTKAVRKFQDVDKWELSFEERMRSSSPVDAR